MATKRTADEAGLDDDSDEEPVKPGGRDVEAISSLCEEVLDDAETDWKKENIGVTPTTEKTKDFVGKAQDFQELRSRLEDEHSITVDDEKLPLVRASFEECLHRVLVARKWSRDVSIESLVALGGVDEAAAKHTRKFLKKVRESVDGDVDDEVFDAAWALAQAVEGNGAAAESEEEGEELGSEDSDEDGEEDDGEDGEGDDEDGSTESSE